MALQLRSEEFLESFVCVTTSLWLGTSSFLCNYLVLHRHDKDVQIPYQHLISRVSFEFSYSIFMTSSFHDIRQCLWLFFFKIILREKNLFIVSILSQAFCVGYKQSSASYVQARPQVRRSGSNAWGVLDIKNLTNIQSHDRWIAFSMIFHPFVWSVTALLWLTVFYPPTT